MKQLSCIVPVCYPLSPTDFSMLSAIVDWFTVPYPLSPTACKNKTLIPNPIALEIWAHNSFWVERKSNLKFEIWSQFDSEIIILGVYPLVHPTFSEGNIGSTQSSDPQNERSCLSHLKNHFKNIGCGGTRSQSTSKELHRYHYIYNYMYVRFTVFGEPSDYLMNVMRLRSEKHHRD